MSETPHRYTAELAGQIEVAWQDRWAGGGHLPRAEPGRARGPSREAVAEPARSSSSSTCSPTRRGAGLHVGHPLGYIATDVFARFNRMIGKNVLHCLGYDAFGLPAEQYAVQTGQHPRKTTEDNIVTMKRQLRRLGPGPRRPAHDRDDRPRLLPLDAVDLPADLQLLVRRRRACARTAARAGPARSPSSSQQFESGRRARCPPRRARLGRPERRPSGARHPRRAAAGLHLRGAGELVPGPGHGAVQRGGHQRRPLRARQLPGVQAQPAPVDDADHRVRRPAGRRPRPGRLAREGQAHAAQLDRPQPGCPGDLPRASGQATRRSRSSPPAPTRCSARPSWCWRRSTRCWTSIVPQGGWPEGTKDVVDGRRGHPEGGRRGIPARRRRARATSSARPRARTRPVCSPAAFATNPVNGEQVPVFVADYVLMGYGTGAIMAVPGQDDRDWEFADAFELPIVRTVQPAAGHPEDEAYTGEGPAINSANDEISLDGMDVAEAKAAHHRLAAGARASASGPSPTSCATGCSAASATGASRSRSSSTRTAPRHALPESMLPVDAAGRARTTRRRPSSPTTPQSTPGAAALAGRTEWVEVELDLGDGRGVQKYRRETNTMPNWAGSCWYYLRYLDPANSERPRRPRERGVLDGPARHAGRRRAGGHARPRWRRPLRRRRRACRAAPALRPLLAQGAARPRPPERARSRSASTSARATSRPTRTRDARGQYVPAEEVEETPDVTAATRSTRGRASRSTASTARSASR